MASLQEDLKESRLSSRQRGQGRIPQQCRSQHRSWKPTETLTLYLPSQESRSPNQRISLSTLANENVPYETPLPKLMYTSPPRRHGYVTRTYSLLPLAGFSVYVTRRYHSLRD